MFPPNHQEDKTEWWLAAGSVAFPSRWNLKEKFGLPMDCPNINLDKVLAAMSLDKKAIGSSLRWVFLEDIGRATTRTGVSQEIVQRILQSLNR